MDVGALMPLISPTVKQAFDSLGYTKADRETVLVEFNKLCVEAGFTGENVVVPDEKAVELLDKAVINFTAFHS